MTIAVSNHDVIGDIHFELRQAREKFPNTHDLFVALTEEVGELAKALIQQKHEHHKEVTHQDIYKEAIQVACMAIRLATEGDLSFPDFHPESGYRGRAWVGYRPNPGESE